MSATHDGRGRAFPWWLDLAAWAGARVYLGLGATWRCRVLDLPPESADLVRATRCIFALWHARLLMLTYTHRSRGVAALVSRHRDGELITRVIEQMGYVAGRGSSTRGGEEGLRDMIEWAAKGHGIAITPDGPRGPAEIVKPGLVYLASRSGLPVIPVAAAAGSEWRLRSWDGFRVPRPFARVGVAYGAPVRVPADLDRDGIERWRSTIESAVAAVTRECDRRIGVSA